MILTVTSSLEDLRNGIFYETRDEFARRLGITAQTYRRLLARDPAIANPTRRQIATRLGVPPHLIAELVPPPTPERLAALTEAIQTANATHDWYLLAEDGSITPAPDVICRPGDASPDSD
jgi:transcriptional regulator with XRE-family HTH domain